MAMQEYMTRHMVAQRAMRYADRALQPGDRFIATPVDEQYLRSRGHAVSVPDIDAVAAVPLPIAVEPEQPAPVVEAVAAVAEVESVTPPAAEPGSMEDTPIRPVPRKTIRVSGRGAGYIGSSRQGE